MCLFRNCKDAMTCNNPRSFAMLEDWEEHMAWDHLRHLPRIPEMKISKCPFGDGFTVLERGESDTAFASQAMDTHIAAHMAEIALLVLHDSKPPQPVSERGEWEPLIDQGGKSR